MKRLFLVFSILLANLAAFDKSSDAVTRYDYVLKTIDCYNSAVGKDSNAARARFTEKRVDMDAVAKNYNANLSKFQQAVSDSMNF